MNDSQLALIPFKHSLRITELQILYILTILIECTKRSGIAEIGSAYFVNCETVVKFDTHNIISWSRPANQN